MAPPTAAAVSDRLVDESDVSADPVEFPPVGFASDCPKLKVGLSVSVCITTPDAFRAVSGPGKLVLPEMVELLLSPLALALALLLLLLL